MKKFRFKIKGITYDVEIKSFENNVAEIDVNGTTYKVDVDVEVKKTKTPTLLRKEISRKIGEGKIKKTESTGVTPIKAPLPGSIIKILVNEGDTINKGDNLLIMEAMKMENNVLAEKSGIIKTIKVAVGDTVLQNDVLLEIE